MYPAKKYQAALVKLGGRVGESQRMMLVAHASAPRKTLDVVDLAQAAGKRYANYTHSQYGRLGHMIAGAIGHRHAEIVWTRLIGSDSRHPKNGHVQWRMHDGLADAVRAMGWTQNMVLPAINTDLANASAQLSSVDQTTRDALIQARLKQGEFRQSLIRMWGSCAVTGCDVLEALVASHIKPWRDSTNQERLNPHNGLLLIGNLDCLFDRGLITFDKDGILLTSPRLSTAQQRILGIRPNMRIQRLDSSHLPFLKWHRTKEFLAD